MYKYKKKYIYEDIAYIYTYIYHCFYTSYNYSNIFFKDTLLIHSPLSLPRDVACCTAVPVHLGPFPTHVFRLVRSQLSHEKTLITFHYTGWLIGVLIMVYYNPYITGWYNHQYNPTNQVVCHCSIACFSITVYTSVAF